jgi:hypothetical protein
MKDLLLALKALLNANAAVIAYPGWAGAFVTVLDFSIQIGGQKCGVLLRPDKSVESDYAENPYQHDGTEDLNVDVKSTDHMVDIYCCFRLDEATTEALMTDTGALMDFTATVQAALRKEDLGKTVKLMELQEAEWGINVPGVTEEDAWIVANRIRIRVRSLHFEG